MSKFFSRKLFFHSTYLPEFLEFSVEWFAFGNSTVSGISGNFSGKFLCHLPLFPHFRTVWLNRKRPYFPCSTPRVFDINPSQTIITKKRKQECKCLKLKSLNASPEVNIFHETQLHKCKKDTSLASSVFSLAYENIRFSSLFAAGDVSRGGSGLLSFVCHS